MENPKVLLVTTEEKLVEEAREMLEEEHGAEVSYAESREEAERIIEDQELDFVVIGEEIKGGSPVDLFNHILQQHPSLNTVILAQDIDTEEMERRPEKVVPYDQDKLEMALDVLADTIETSMELEVGTTYPKPEKEEERLEAVGSIDFDSLHEENICSTFTEKVHGVFDVEVCYISIMGEEEEEFLSCCGRNIDPTSRKDSVCSYALVVDEVMVIENIKENEEFNHLGCAKKEGLLWYALAPITLDDHPVGALILADSGEQEFNEEQKERLKEFAEEFSEKLEKYRD